MCLADMTDTTTSVSYTHLAAFHDLAFQGIAQFPLGIPDSSAGDAPFQSRLVDVLAEQMCIRDRCGAGMENRSGESMFRQSPW